MKRSGHKLWGIPAAVLAAAAIFASCATTGGGGAPVYEGDGVSLAEAIEQSAEKIAADLPEGSRVAIVAWESPGEGLSDYIIEELTGALVDRGMEVADRQNLAYVYRELNLQMSGDVSDESARSIGKFLGAGLVITGQLTALGGPYRYRAAVVHVENATRDSVTRLDVRGDAGTRRLIAALANQKPAAKTASSQADGTSAPKTAVPQTAGAFFDRGLTLLNRGFTLFNQQEFESAIADFTQAIRLNPNYANAYNNRGFAYYGKKDYDRAIADFTQAISLDPNYAPTYYNRGDAYRGKGDNDRAIADYTQAIRLDPDNADTYNNRGDAYYDKKDYDRAIADFTQTIRLNPNYAAAYYNRGSAYHNNKDYDTAIGDYTQAIRIDPNFVYAYNNRGSAYADKNDYDTVIADFTQAIRLDPNDAGAYNNRGNAYIGNGDLDKAIADYEVALRIDPNNALIKSNLENARRVRGIRNGYPPPPVCTGQGLSENNDRDPSTRSRCRSL